jgi:phenylalanyl-tRNA synthetase alpha subunit
MTLSTEKINQTSKTIQQKILAAQNKEELKKIKKEYLGKGGVFSQIFHQAINLNNPEEKKERIELINE